MVDEIAGRFVARGFVVDGDRRVLRRFDGAVEQHDGNAAVVQDGEVLEVGSFRR